MKRSKRLQPVVMLAQRQENDAARQLGKHQRKLAEQTKQLDELIAYRDQYIHGFQQAGRGGMNAAQLHDYQIFLRQLDNAIQQQKQQLLLSREEYGRSQHNWQESRGHVKAMDIVVEGHQRREQNELMRREQREMDDRVQALARK